jgi:hypothetical protein
MRSLGKLLVASALCALVFLAAPGYSTAASCRPVVNPYEGSRYEGVNIRRIRALGVPCRKARQVARRAHRKALRLTPTPSGIRHFRWRGWKVRGDIRRPVDRYVAKRPGARVRWRF